MKGQPSSFHELLSGHQATTDHQPYNCYLIICWCLLWPRLWPRMDYTSTTSPSFHSFHFCIWNSKQSGLLAQHLHTAFPIVVISIQEDSYSEQDVKVPVRATTNRVDRTIRRRDMLFIPFTGICTSYAPEYNRTKACLAAMEDSIPGTFFVDHWLHTRSSCYVEWY